MTRKSGRFARTRWIVGSLAPFLLVGWAGADTYPRQVGLDVQHYVFHIELRDDTDEIQGHAAVTVRFLTEGVTRVDFDLVSVAEAKGMKVTGVTADGRALAFVHQNDRLTITLPTASEVDQERTLDIAYRGVPAAGLRIGPNKHGERTFFSQNWPNRARHWLPTVDHPHDKATGEFVVTAPAHYQVVANGQLTEETDLPGSLRRTHWTQSIPIASWLFTLGAARFAVEYPDPVKGIPLQTWVFPQDREIGFRAFGPPARRALEFFSEQIGPFAYQKLASVEAAGFGGGMEHASAIFYGETAVTGRPLTNLVVHETAHQWFGDSVTESDWDDVWLSEGFATYLTLLYTEHAEGRDAFAAGLKRTRDSVIEAEKRDPDRPIVHRGLSDMSQVLNTFVYQKAGFVLHMLRRLVRTDRFWAGLRDYYRLYRDRTATTADFRRVMEVASGQDLRWFFEQWLNRPGIPKIEGLWKFDASTKKLTVDLKQVHSAEPFRVQLDLGLSVAGKGQQIETVELRDRAQRFEFALDQPPAAVILDPDTWALMELGAFTGDAR